MSFPDAKKKILCTNPRRRPANAVLLSPRTAESNGESAADSPLMIAHSSSVFVSPMSALGHEPSYAQASGSERPTGSPVVSAATNANAGRRPSTLYAVKPHADTCPEPGELTPSISASSITMHRRPSSLDVTRRSSLAAAERSPTTGAPLTNTGTLIKARAARGPANVSLLTSTRRSANKEAPAEAQRSPPQTSIGDQQVSYSTLHSPQDLAFPSDLGVSREGVDWERVDADSRDLYRQRNTNTTAMSMKRQSTKPVNDEEVVNLEHTLVTAAPVEQSPSSTPRQESASRTVDANCAAATSAALASVPGQQTTSAPRLRHQPQSCSFDSSVLTESATCDVEDAIDVCLPATETERTEEGSPTQPNSGTSVASGTDNTATPSLAEEKGDARRAAVADGEAIRDVPATTYTSERASTEEAATVAPTAAAALPKDGDIDIFVAVRVRPGTSAGSDSSGRPSAPAVGSCVRADARRGFVDCSTVVPAGVRGGSTLTGTTMTNGASAAAGGVFDKVDTAAGKRTRTLRFFFDHILDEHVAQREVMDRIGQRAVERVLAGYHGTVICYGQSGSGKTHTILGPNGGKLGKDALRWHASASAATSTGITPVTSSPGTPAGDGLEREAPAKEHVRFAAEVGLLPRMLQALFSGLGAQHLDSDNRSGQQGDSLASWSVTLSAVELYNEELRDLLPNSIVPKRKKRRLAAAAEEEEEEAATREVEEAGFPISLSRKGGGGCSLQEHTQKKEPRGGRAKEVAAAAAATSTAAPSPSGNGKALRNNFPSYPGLFGLKGTSSVEDKRCWDAEDLEVLNAVSSSDDDSDTDGSDLENTNSSANSNGSRNSGDALAGSPDIRNNMVVLPTLPPGVQADGDYEEPDPSRPTANSIAPMTGTDTARGRMTIGMLTSLSPSPPRLPQRVAAKKQVLVVDARDALHTTTTAAAATAANGAENSARPSTVQTRISRRLPHGTGGGGKSLSPTPKSQARSAGTSSNRTATRTSPSAATTTAAAGTSSYSSVSGGGGQPLVIRQGQPPSSPTASATPSFNPSSSPKGVSRATSTKSRSDKRSRPGHHSRAARDGAEGNVYIEGLREHPMRNLQDAMRAVRLALHRRQMASTELNCDSSRAHTFFFVKVAQRRWRRRSGCAVGAARDGEAAKGKEEHPGKLIVDVRRSTLTLVDLAGSERVSHTGADGMRLKEAQNINLSLSALGNVMRLLSAAAPKATSPAAAASDAHIPYRDSKLTRILQSSLGGNAITFLLCNVSPDYRDASETMSTLRFAKLSRTVKNKARLNESTAIEEEGSGSSNAASAALVARYKREHETALAAVLSAETKMRELVGDTASVRDQVRQLAAYAWWLEEQLGHFASRSRAAIVAAPPSTTGDLRIGEVNSSVGPLSDTERVCVCGCTTTTTMTTENVSNASGCECESGGGNGNGGLSWWRLSPRPRTPPSLGLEKKGTASSSGEGASSGDNTNATAYWQSDAARTFLSSSYSLKERQGEMQRRLIAAAVAAGVGPEPLPAQQQASPACVPLPLTSHTGAAHKGWSAVSTSPIFSASAEMSVRGNLRLSGEPRFGAAADSRQQTALSVIAPESSMVEVSSSSFSLYAEGQEQQQQQRHDAHQLMSNFAVALAEERRARSAAQADAAAVERQNLLLRLRLSALQRPQKHEGAETSGKEESTGKHPSASLATFKAPSTDPLITTTTTTVTAPDSDSTPSIPTPAPPLPHLQSSLPPPHYSRTACETSLEAFLARCGFVKLDASMSTATAAAAMANVSPFAIPPDHTSTTLHTAAFTSGHSPPSNAHSVRGIVVDPASLRALRSGSVPREAKNFEVEDTDDALSTDNASMVSALAVVNARKGRGVVVGAGEGCVGGAGGSYTRQQQQQQQPRLLRGGSGEREKESASPQRSRSQGWGQQLLDGVRNTLETVRAISTHGTFYEPEDMNTSV